MQRGGICSARLANRGEARPACLATTKRDDHIKSSEGRLHAPMTVVFYGVVG